MEGNRKLIKQKRKIRKQKGILRRNRMRDDMCHRIRWDGGFDSILRDNSTLRYIRDTLRFLREDPEYDTEFYTGLFKQRLYRYAIRNQRVDICKVREW